VEDASPGKRVRLPRGGTTVSTQTLYQVNEVHQQHFGQEGRASGVCLVSARAIYGASLKLD
jgi:hypothetical protein